MLGHDFSHLARCNTEAAGRAICHEDLGRMRQMPLLAQVPPNLLSGILAEAVIEHHPPGSTLFCQGEMPRFLHIVMDGEIGLFGTARDGGETVVSILKNGEAFITAAVLTGRPYLMGARALTAARVLMLPGERLCRDLQSVPDLAMAMLTSLSTHFRAMVREVKVLKLQTPTQRLALYLMSLTPKREGMAILWLPHRKSVIAARIGVRPETLSRVFSALRQYGVRVNALRVTVDDMAVLAELCQQDEDQI